MASTIPFRSRHSPAAVLESIADPVVAFDKQWRYTYVSRRAAEALGKEPEEMLGKCMWDLFPEDAGTGFQEACQRAWSEGKPVTVERRSIVLGTWVETYIFPFEDGASTQWRDITERKRAEEALRESEERSRLVAELLEKADQPFGTGYPDGSLGFVNPAFERLVGYTPDELRAIGWAALTAPEWRDIERAHLEELHRNGRSVKYEKEYLRKDGTRVPVEMLIDLGAGSDGQPLYYAFITDLTERKRSEEALRESEAQFRTLANAIPQLCWIANADGWLFWYNRRWYEYTGTTPEQMEGWGWQSVHDPEALPAVLERWKASIATGEPFDMIFPLRGADGVFRPFLTRVAPLRGRDGKVTRWFGTNTDVSEQRKVEQTLHEQREWLRVTLSSIGDAVLATDASGTISFFNPCAARLTGWSEEEAAGRPAEDVFRIVNEQSGQPEADIIRRVLREGCTVGLANHTALITRDGCKIPIEDSAAPIRDAAGNVAGAVLVFHDVTEKRRAHEKLQNVLNSITDGLLVLDSDWRYSYFSEQGARMIGMRPEDLLGRSMWDLFPHAKGTKFEEGYRRAVETGRPVEFEEFYPEPVNKWLECHCYPSADGLSVYFHDVTARKAAEEALRQSEERFRVAQELSPDGFAILRPLRDVSGGVADFEFVYQNTASARRRGHDPKSVAGSSLLELYPALRGSVFHKAYTEVAETGETRVFEAPFHFQAQLEPVWFRTVVVPMGRDIAVLSQDMTERKRAEETLRLSEEKFAAAFATSPAAIAMTRLEDGVIFEVNATWQAMFGYSRDEVVGRPTTSLGIWQTPEDRDRCIRELLANGHFRNWELTLQRRSGELVVALVSAETLMVAGEQVVFSTWLDISERKRAEEALRNSEKQLQDIIDGNPGIVFVKDLEGRFIVINRSLEQLLGVTREKIRGKTDYDLFARDRAEYYRQHDRQVAESSTPMQVEEVIDLADGRHYVFLANKFPLRDQSGRIHAVCGISTDITERKQSEERIREAQRLESLGLLAGGVAHDFNNLLVGVIGNASLAQEMLPPDHPSVELIEAVIKTGEQAAHLTRQMLAYAGKGKFLTEALNISAIVREMTGLVRPSISKKIGLLLELEEELPPVDADRGQVQQVLMNLAINAAEAIGSREGVITIRTGVQAMDEAYLRLHPEVGSLRPGQYLFLEVRDTGCGMDDATRARIFDPFFTTKFTGRGLGLAAVAGIVRGHNGGIAVSSTPGQGSRFTVWLPAGAMAATEAPGVPQSTALQGSGVVLVVDDEEVVREMTKKALERHGYTVLLAESGLAAIDVARRHPGDIALVILDLSMPRMTGEEALPVLRNIRPEVKVLLSSGYSEAETMPLFRGQQVSGFVQKPYTATRIAEKVKLALE